MKFFQLIWLSTAQGSTTGGRNMFFLHGLIAFDDTCYAELWIGAHISQQRASKLVTAPDSLY